MSTSSPATFIAGLALLAIAGATSAAYSLLTVQKDYQFTVLDKKIEQDTEEDSEGNVSTTTYRLATVYNGESIETINTTNNLWHWKWDARRRFGELQECVTYKARVYGWNTNTDFLHRNIIDYKPVPESETRDTAYEKGLPEKCQREIGTKAPRWAEGLKNQ